MQTSVRVHIQKNSESLSEHRKHRNKLYQTCTSYKWKFVKFRYKIVCKVWSVEAVNRHPRTVLKECQDTHFGYRCSIAPFLARLVASLVVLFYASIMFHFVDVFLVYFVGLSFHSLVNFARLFGRCHFHASCPAFGCSFSFLILVAFVAPS